MKGGKGNTRRLKLVKGEKFQNGRRPQRTEKEKEGKWGKKLFGVLVLP